MRVVIYKINGIETKSYTEKVELEKRFHTKAVLELREVEREKPKLSPIRQTMMDQFGFVSKSLLEKVVV